MAERKAVRPGCRALRLRVDSRSWVLFQARSKAAGLELADALAAAVADGLCDGLGWRPLMDPQWETVETEVTEEGWIIAQRLAAKESMPPVHAWFVAMQNALVPVPPWSTSATGLRAAFAANRSLEAA